MAGPNIPPRNLVFLPKVEISNTKQGGGGGCITRSGVQDQLDEHSETLISTKNTKIIWAWWQAPVIPTTQETEAGELLEPRRQTLQ